MAVCIVCVDCIGSGACRRHISGPMHRQVEEAVNRMTTLLMAFALQVTGRFFRTSTTPEIEWEVRALFVAPTSKQLEHHQYPINFRHRVHDHPHGCRFLL